MLKTEVVNYRGFLSNYTITRERIVYIGRASKGKSHMLNTKPRKRGWLGNPFTLEIDGAREECIAKFRQEFSFMLQLNPVFKKQVRLLQGSKLNCFCHPLPCHGDVIAEYLNSGCPDDFK